MIQAPTQQQIEEIIKRLKRAYALGRVNADNENYMCPATLKDVREAADALEALAAEREWKPIANAPRDGRNLLLSWGEDRIRIGAWVAHRDVSHPFVWEDQSGSVLVRPWKDDTEPTHYRELPAPPKTEEGCV